ncbi:hypothetical protein [Brevundimonas sp.]|uniref:hypothetical protein n=1 Tax=Brevundimonas sp. TaxID=1871086 RepID=UPI0019ACA697|nr:hypothetical protein [Brevundimonas sp.]MBD3835452.1 hypothetical protein [Brevundimonas sp.]
MIALLLALADPQLVETGLGRFAQFADVGSIEREGDVARMRSLQVAEEGFHVGDVLYVGGWSWWAFDCRARTADRLDFASLREDGVEGPATPDPAPAYDAAPGGDAAELLGVACGERRPERALTLDQAIERGQLALAD